MPTVALAQTSRPAGLDFEALLKKAAERPVEKMELLTAGGKKLGEGQRKAVEKSDGLMTGSERDRERGDYAGAGRQAREALALRERILGKDHHLSVSARVRAEAMEAWAKIPKDQQSRLAESDGQLQSSSDLHDKGEFKAAREAAERALALFERVLPQDHVETGAAVLQLGSVLLDLSELEKADANLSRALRIVEGAYGRDHPRTARVLDRLGWLRFRQARRSGAQASVKMKEAIDLFERAVGIFRKTVGEDGDLAESLDNMATARTYVGDGHRALEEKCRALVIRRAVLGPDARDTGVSYSNLAWLFDRSKQPETAFRLREQALAIFEKRLGPSHPYTLLELGKLAEHHLSEGRSEEAIRLFEEATRRDALHADEFRPGVLERMGTLGTAYLRADRVREAVATFDRTYERAVKSYERGREISAMRVLFDMANSCRQRRLFDPGIRYLEKVVEYDNARRGREDDLLMTRRAAMLGTLYIETGRLDDGKRVLNDAIERIQKLTDDENIQLAGAMLNLARIHEKEGNLEAAARLCEQVMRISEAKLVRDTYGPAYAQLWLGRIYTMQKRFGLADFALHEAETLFKKFEEADPSGMVTILQERARWHALKGDLEKSVSLLRDALKRSRALAERVKNVHGDALTAGIVKDLLDRTGKAKGGDEKERAAWRSELKTLLLSLKERLALSAEEAKWLEGLEG